MLPMPMRPVTSPADASTHRSCMRVVCQRLCFPRVTGVTGHANKLAMHPCGGASFLYFPLVSQGSQVPKNNFPLVSQGLQALK
jgi:hypothetical protein